MRRYSFSFPLSLCSLLLGAIGMHAQSPSDSTIGGRTGTATVLRDTNIVIKKERPAKNTPEYYEYKIQRYQKFWHSLIPNQARVQYAGSVGMINMGLGWHYGGREHRLWETDFMFGYLPKNHSKDEHYTFTLRQSYIPFRTHLFWQLHYEPLATGLILNTISGDEFWVSEPSRYPHKYYGFSTELRLHVFVGQRLRFEIPRNRRSYVKAVSFCYELSSCDLYLASYVPNRYLSLRDILSLSFSIKVDAF